MPAGDRRFDRRSSSLMIFGGSAAVAIALLAFQPAPDAPRTDRTVRVDTASLSPSCREADRATVAQLAAFLERNGPTDAPILERAIYTLNVARRHCSYDWGRGLDDYRWLGRWLSENS